MDIKDFKNDIKNILIIRRNNIGDMICAIPMLRTFRKEFPSAHITVLAEEANAGIIEGASFINEVIVYRKGDGLYKNKYIGHWNLFRQNRQGFDLAIALKIGFSSTLSLITLISGARLRMGCVPEKWHPLQLCYNLPVKGYKRWKSMHQIDALFEFIKTMGIEKPVKDISIEITPQARNKVKIFFEETNMLHNNIKNPPLPPLSKGGAGGFPGKNNIVVFNISNNKPENTWSIERFRQVSDILLKEYRVNCIITSSPADKDKAKGLLKGVNNNAAYFETPKVMDFAALVAESALLICGEGGAMHIGAGVHTPTISLWGKRRPVKWMPYGEKQFVIKKGEHVNSISAEDVLEVVRKNNLLK